MRSPWPHPSFQGGFLPERRTVGGDGFDAVYRVGNLALGQSLVATGAGTPSRPTASPRSSEASPEGSGPTARPE